MKVPVDSEGRASLPILWVAAGRPKGKNPDFWLRTDSAKKFVAAGGEAQKCDPVRTVSGGKKGNTGTWGHRVWGSIRGRLAVAWTS